MVVRVLNTTTGMPQDTDYADITTVIYIDGHTPTDRRDNLRIALAHAANHCGEDWLSEPGFEKNVNNAADMVKDTEPGRKIDLEEVDWHPPIQHLLILHAKGEKTGLPGLVKGATGTDKRYDIIVTGPDVLCDRSTGVERIARLTEHNNHVHFAETGVTLTPGTEITGAVKRVIMTMSDVVHPSHENDTDSTYAWSGGRPPLGFKVADDGDRLVETEDYRDICLVLQQVLDEKKSKRRAAKELDCARGTIINAIENRPEMYGLQ